MKKELAFAAALPLALGSGLVSAATTTIDGTSGSKSVTVSGSGTSTGVTSMSNLSTNGIADIQVSAGVILKVEDGSGTDIGANDIGVSSCHDGGSAAYWGDTGGGAVAKNSNFGTGNCTTGALGVGNVSTS